MKTRDVLVLCAVIVAGAASLAVAEPIAAKHSSQTLMVAQATAAVAAPKHTPAHASKAKTVDAGDARIARLHTRLRITPAQEALWSDVTEVMQANATAMEPLRRMRAERASTMTAVEDFTSYSEIADVHADGVKRFVPVFAALYDSMSDDQKRNADVLFRRGDGPKPTTSKAR